MRKGLIICGFAGIGKSTLARDNKIVDLESTPFNRNWELYVNVAKHMSNNGYDVALSMHQELRDELTKQQVTYVVVTPEIDAKKEYINRYRERNNDEEFITLMTNNFERFTETSRHERVCYLPKDSYLTEEVIEGIKLAQDL